MSSRKTIKKKVRLAIPKTVIGSKKVRHNRDRTMAKNLAKKSTKIHRSSSTGKFTVGEFSREYGITIAASPNTSMREYLNKSGFPSLGKVMGTIDKSKER